MLITCDISSAISPEEFITSHMYNFVSFGARSSNSWMDIEESP